MPLDSKFIGRRYGPYTYQVGLEKLREFAYAVAGGVPSAAMGAVPDGLNPLLYDEKAARSSPYGSVIAFPTFAVTFAIAPFAAAVSDPEFAIDLLKVVHGEQELEWFGVIRPGDVLTTTGSVTEIYEKAHRDFMVVVSESKNQQGELVVRGTWTAIIRA
jgi:acyl dehydratase